MPWVVSLGLMIALPLLGIYFFGIRLLLNALSSELGWDRQKARRWVLLVCGLVNLLPLVALLTWWFGGRQATVAFSGEVPLLDYLLVYPFWFSLVIAVQFFMLLVLWEAAKVVLYPLYRSSKEVWKRFEPKYVLGAFLFTLLYSTTTIYANTWTIRVHEKEVKLPGQFASLDGIRIVQISDIQGDGRITAARIADFVNRVNALQPDIILYGGDVVTSGQKYVESTVRLFADFRAQYAKVAALGDHDMFSGKRPIIDGLKRVGFQVVEDSTLTLSINATMVSVTVLTYTYRQRPTPESLDLATDNGNDSYKILLVHQPREELVRHAAERGYHLFTAGHTHGGAVAFGIPGIYLWAPSRVETKYFTGFYIVGKTLVSVNNGFGHTLAPIRYHAPVEITLLKLVK